MTELAQTRSSVDGPTARRRWPSRSTASTSSTGSTRNATSALANCVSRGFKGRKSIEVHAVKSVSFDVHVGEAVGIVGSNGSGKSTLLRAIAGLQSLESGSDPGARRRVGLLGVGAALKPTLSGYRNVMLGGLAMGLSSEDDRRRRWTRSSSSPDSATRWDGR